MAEDNKKTPKPSDEGKDFKHLVRIANTDLDGNKLIGATLKRIKGVGFHFADMICSMVGVDKMKKTGNLNDEEIKKLDDAVKDPAKLGAPSWMMNRRKDPEDGEDKHLLLGDLDLTKDNDIKLMKKIKCYRGIRHMHGLPCRGQRTKSNFRKTKGKVMGVSKGGSKKGKV